ncbi:MAG: lamin tail domain-containing protein [Planctomycetota bacterium]
MLKHTTISLLALIAAIYMIGPANAQLLIINEFVARNDSEPPLRNGELLDEDGDASDWIEIYNPSDEAINLDGWFLTDDADDLEKWEFPAVEISRGRFLVVFASGKNRRDADGQMHTNFQLRAGGEFLALVHPDGLTIEQAYDEYPPQFADISYGLSGGTGSTRTDTILVPEFTAAKALIPTDGSPGLRWTEAGFDDSAWLTGVTGVGYDYAGLIGLDVGAMRNNNETVYARISFEVGDISEIDELILRMKFEDGFVAYLNGIPVASFNANDPENTSWNEGATATREDSIAVVFEDFNITDHIGALRTGNNVLAIHGLNTTLGSSDLLILPELTATKIETVDLPSMIEGYFYEPTPGKDNSSISINLGPSIHNVTENPPRPYENEDLIITAEVTETFEPINQVRLLCYVNFEFGSRWLPEEGLPMVDDGSGADEKAGDGIYTASIPSLAYNPGDMIRWKVTASDTKGNTSRYPLYPYPNDSPEYFGTVATGSFLNSRLPVIEWFVENVSASETRGGTRCSVYYLGEFYDNVDIHIRGGSTATRYPKRHFKFRFNRGYKFSYDPNKPRVDEFNLNSPYSDKAYLRQNLAFNAYDWCGCPGSESFPMRAQRNGRFYGVQIFIEEPEEELLEREGFDPDGALYKMYSTFTSPGEKKTREWEGTSDIRNFISSINNTSGTTLHNNIFDQVNLPLTLNYLVATIITHQNDHPHKNHYLYRDSDGSGEWFFMPWDHDLTWGSNWIGSSGGSYCDIIYADDDQVQGRSTSVKPSHPFVGKQDCKEWNNHWNHLIDALLSDATVRQMYLRRLRTVMDELLKAPGTPYNELFIEGRIDELVETMAPDVALDYNIWANPWPWGGQGGYPRDQSFQYAINVLKNDYLAVRRTHLFVTHNVNRAGSYNISGSYSALIPNAQPANPAINFGTFEYNPASGNQDEEYIQLNNPNTYAVDISGWKLSGGIEHTFLPGTVIVAGGSLYVSPDAAAFRARAASPTGGRGLFVQGNYRRHLSNWGETVNLFTEKDYLIDTMTYAGNPSDQQRYLRITEIMYHPAQAGTYNEEEYEFIELQNIGTSPVSLDGVKLTDGIYYQFPFGGNLYLASGDYIVLVKNRDAFVWLYGTDGINIAPDVYTGSLSNGGERIKLEDRTNSTILEFKYDDDWYMATDGEGFSLTITDPTNPDLDSWDQRDSWRPSAHTNGSPGLR